MKKALTEQLQVFSQAIYLVSPFVLKFEAIKQSALCITGIGNFQNCIRKLSQVKKKKKKKASDTMEEPPGRVTMSEIHQINQFTRVQ